MEDRHTRLYALALSLGAAFACLIPALLGWMGGDGYLGSQYNTDDHMVYAAWMRQAMDGHLLFDNRFTTDSQPGLTFNAYFLVLGWMAKALGIVLTMALARAVLTGLFVWLLCGFVSRMTPEVYTRKLAVAVAVVGGGVGFLVWQNLGVDVQRSVPSWLNAVMLGHVPIDVWQPEAFVFPSMLTNGLFMASLCLILLCLTAVLDARESWRPVPIGFLAFTFLANIHSYDVVLLGLVLLAFLAASVTRRQATWAWVLRSLLMALGTVGPALWLAHVLRQDAVFRARAATETFSPNFRAVAFGLLLLIVFAIAGLWRRSQADPSSLARRRAGLALLAAALAAMFIAAGWQGSGYWMGPVVWGLVLVGAVVLVCLVAGPTSAANLFWSWAIVGLVAIFIPALFQRKLAVGLAIPWAVLAAIGLASPLERLDRGARNLASVLVILVLGASSYLWVFRELALERMNVSNTTMHPVFLSTDAQNIVAYLGQRSQERTVVLAMPGVRAAPEPGQPPDALTPPLIPDFNPILSGLAGVYTYAGHWSETPDYLARRARLTRFFLASDRDNPNDLIQETRATYIVAPVAEAFAGLGASFRDFRPYGQVVIEGSKFRLIRLR